MLMIFYQDNKQIIMKKAENSIKPRQWRDNYQENLSLRGAKTPVTEKSQTKFNRKPEGHLPESKKQIFGEIESQIRYISPGRNSFSPSSPSAFCISNLSFQEISHKFALSSKQLNIPVRIDLEEARNNKNQESIKYQFASALEKQEEKHTIICNHKESEKLQENITRIKEQNQAMRADFKDLEVIKQARINKEGFNHIICQNTRLSKELSLKSKDNQKLVQEVSNLNKELQELKQKLTNQQQIQAEHAEKIQTQKSEIEMILKANLQLTTLLNIKSQQENIFTQRYKENSSSPNRPNLKTRQKQRCNTFVQQSSNTVLDPQVINKVKGSYPLYDSIKQFSSPDKWSSDLMTGCSETTEEPACNEKVKQLKQKVRYCEIEIDILKRVKMSGDQQAKDNQKLRKTNHKLLQRLSFLRQSPSRRRNSVHSDSSLSLSLSPSHY